MNIHIYICTYLHADYGVENVCIYLHKYILWIYAFRYLGCKMMQNDANPFQKLRASPARELNIGLDSLRDGSTAQCTLGHFLPTRHAHTCMSTRHKNLQLSTRVCPLVFVLISFNLVVASQEQETRRRVVKGTMETSFSQQTLHISLSERFFCSSISCT